MLLIPKKVIALIGVILTLFLAGDVVFAGSASLAKSDIEYSRNPATVIISFHVLIPEFADQDPTPLLRVYGDGRVVVFQPSYMKQAGQYEMMLSRNELEDLLLQVTSTLMEFDAKDVKQKKKLADDLLWESASDWRDITVFHDSDAEISVFNANVESIRPNGDETQRITNPNLEKSWRGLRYDARDYLGVESIQALMQVETSLKALTRHSELERVN